MMNNNEFRFRVQNLSYGWCRVNMLINDKEINFNAGYFPIIAFNQRTKKIIAQNL